MIEVIGWTGAGCLLAAYWLLSAKRINPGIGYQILNLAGAVMLAANGAAHQAIPSVAVNVVWVAIGAKALHTLSRHPQPAAHLPPSGSRTVNTPGTARGSSG